MKKLSLCLFLLATSFTFSQEKQKIVILQNDDVDYTMNPSKRKGKRVVEHKQAYKFDMLRMFIGEINFALEQRVSDRSSVEFELGPTVSNLVLIKDNHLGNSANYSRNSAMGVLFSAAYRYYPLDGNTTFNRLYVSPKLKYSRFNESISAPNTSLSDIKGNVSQLMFGFNIGYQQWVADAFAFDYYFGLNIGNYNSLTYNAITQYDGNTNSWKDAWVKDQDKFGRLSATIGVKMTIGR